MENFNFFIPAEFEFEKAGSGDKNDRYKNMIVQGVASTNDIDLDQQILEPSGFVLDSFLSTGLINYEHQAKNTPKAYIGEPLEATVKDNKFFVKGRLWEKSPLARDLYDTVEVMKSSNSKRKLAWSIEGVPLMKDPHNPNRITKAMISHVALTFAPKNGNTYADIVKGEWRSKDQYDYEIPTDVDYLYKGVFGDNEYTLNKDFTITRKAMVAGSETGQQLVGKDTHGEALKKESLDEDLKILTIPIEVTGWIADNWEDFKRDTRRALRKALHNKVNEGILAKEKTLNKKLLEEKDGVKIYSVNGDYIRNSNPGLDFDEFVEGGHHYVTSSPKYAKNIPEDEIWIDDVHLIKSYDLQAIVLHELVERSLMKDHKLSYDKAHTVANSIQKAFRGNVKEGDGLEVRDVLYNQILKKYKDKKDALQKAFDAGLISREVFEKARSGVYKDIPENRKLGRVGQHYGSKKAEEKKVGEKKAEEKKVSSSEEEKLLRDAKNEDWHIRKAAMQHPNATEEVLKIGAKDEDVDVRRAVMKNPNVTPEILKIGAKDEDWQVRWYVMSNPSATEEILKQGIEDKDKWVRKAAEDRLKELKTKTLQKAFDAGLISKKVFESVHKI